MMENEIRVSVVMSVYNEPIAFVDKAVHSILNQTYSDFEFIILLDSPDNQEMRGFLEFLKEQDERIILIFNDENLGLAASLNQGMKIAKGEYIARMDADDISKPERLRRELEYIQENNFDMIGCLADKMDENDQVWDVIAPMPEQESYFKKILPVQNIFIHPTVMMKKSVAKELGGYRLFTSCQDYDLWLRMLTEGYRISILNENLFSFRRHKNSISSSNHYIQILNEKYIRKLYKERIESHREDHFSEENLKKYLNAHGAENKKKLAFERECFEKYQDGLKLIKSNQMIRGIRQILISLRAFAVRESIKISVRAKYIGKTFNYG